MMSVKEAEAFIRQVMQDEDLLDELNSRIDVDGEEEVDPEEVQQKMAEVVPDLASEHGHEFTAEEGFEALQSILEEQTSSELSDEELEQVAGGKSSTQKAAKGMQGTMIASSAATLGTMCAALSAAEVVTAGPSDCKKMFTGEWGL